MSSADQLPPSLRLPPRLTAHKYFFVCSLTVAIWDTFILAPRHRKLMKTRKWTGLKILFNFLRVFMLVEFTVVAVAFFSTKLTPAQCERFYLFEPICTAILLAATSAIHVIRIDIIYTQNRKIFAGLCALFAVQIVVTGLCCAFYRSVPLEIGQGCIAGPKYNWVGIYWVAPTLLYTVTFALVLRLSIKKLRDEGSQEGSQDKKPHDETLSLWRLTLRHSINLYGATWFVNITNMFFWFIVTPNGTSDTIKTIVTSMVAVITTSMSLRIVLAVPGTLSREASVGSTTAQPNPRVG